MISLHVVSGLSPTPRFKNLGYAYGGRYKQQSTKTIRTSTRYTGVKTQPFFELLMLKHDRTCLSVDLEEITCLLMFANEMRHSYQE